MRHLTVLQDAPVADTRPDPKVRGEGALAALEVPFLFLDRYLPARLNPFAQTGAIANVSFIIAAITGVLLLIWYSPSVYQAWPSLDAMRGSFLAQLTRSMHRYSSDACMLFVVLHAWRLTAARRFSGARWLAWVTGIVLIGSLWLVGWLGYWLVWDEPARRIAVGSAKVLDVLPIFADPMGRSFLTDKSVHSLLFFTVFFMHMLLPLAMGVALWLHITRLNRSKFLTDRPMTIAVVVSLIVLSIALPAVSSSPAKMVDPARTMNLDAWYLLPIAIIDRLGGGLIWLLTLVAGIASFAVPWVLARGRAAPAEVNLAKCDGCTLCAVDCPYGAISMEPRTDGRKFKVQAVIDPAKCVGCGICAGSCDSSAIGVPSVSQVEARQRIDRWIDEVIAEESEPYVAFACSRSAAATLRVDAATGRCDALPGYRVMPVICAGWVHALTIERALRHGARGVLMVACGGVEPQYREGPAHTRSRMAGHRDPALRLDKIDASRVRVLELDRTRVSELTRAAEEFRQGKAKPVMGKQLLPIAIAAALIAIIGVGSKIGYAGGQHNGPELVVSFKHAGRTGEHCRKLTDEDKAKLPPHMRTNEICERGRASVRLRVAVDGAVRLERAYVPKGLRGDGPSIAVEHVALTPGSHTITVAIGDSHDPNEWTHRHEQSINVAEHGRVVVLFDKNTGFSTEAP